MPRRKQHVQEMEKYGAKISPSMTKITLGPMFTEWEAQRSAGGFGPTCQQQWIKHLLEVHSLACNGQGCARMYEGTIDTQENTTVNRPRGRPRGSTSPRSTSPRNPSSPGRSRGRPRKATSPHRNTSMYVESVMNQEDEDKEEEEEEEKYEEKVQEEETIMAIANGENGHKEHDIDGKEQWVSSSEIDGQTQSQDMDATGLEDIGEADIKVNENPLLDSTEAVKVEENNVNETVAFEPMEEKPTPATEDSKVLELASSFFNNRLHELYPQAAISQSNNMPIDLTTRMMGYPFPNIHRRFVRYILAFDNQSTMKNTVFTQAQQLEISKTWSKT
ncbi:uncharacterized protein [Amphiura filiformis]|uniref:uncharacterized protein n=1 Tax=Amphiura filiformis TaxID=82378 RepID=UPI003B22294D